MSSKVICVCDGFKRDYDYDRSMLALARMHAIETLDALDGDFPVFPIDKEVKIICGETTDTVTVRLTITATVLNPRNGTVDD